MHMDVHFWPRVRFTIQTKSESIDNNLDQGGFFFTLNPDTFTSLRAKSLSCYRAIVTVSEWIPIQLRSIKRAVFVCPLIIWDCGAVSLRSPYAVSLWFIMHVYELSPKLLPSPLESIIWSGYHRIYSIQLIGILLRGYRGVLVSTHNMNCSLIISNRNSEY